ncbi:sigma-70 family RNA polymerase sigma factor [Mycolicibacterium sp. 018/SC-01/001]|uniref:sigma-70 family RNA polymerase sigma factor n=1 Tax=Mycolicibacterium sp. 018/SC-01/001 TaxID=2592069 RepID=UPI00117E15B6|nr:sigma-70 family RNA polymerase sigma factor [Mycolicibacterium sp. 018/SC-01/001]TRW86263.1 sigma-70 family RNA polymerase sigma factor [Mycolicibacterium sp. 018/SC-01/001]
MTIDAIVPTSRPDTDAAARFARDIRPHLEVLERGARRRTLCRADADDLMQDTLMRAFIGLHTFEPGTNFRAWLFRIMYNQWVTTYRAKQSRVLEVCIGTGADHEVSAEVQARHAAPASAEDEYIATVPTADVRAALETLPEGFTEVLYYADIEGHTYAETAAILGVPVGTVMSRIHRARRRLRLALAGPPQREALAIDRISA